MAVASPAFDITGVIAAPEIIRLPVPFQPGVPCGKMTVFTFDNSGTGSLVTMANGLNR